jgi:hypothetical protein
MAKKITAKSPAKPTLSGALILNKFILHLFGVKDLEALSENLKDAALEGYDENNVSHFHHALVNRFYANPNLPKELLYQYDQNIYSHTRTISSNRNEPISWKYFQYLALLFTEIYLDRYFTDRELLLQELNTYFTEKFLKDANTYKELTPYTIDADINDLNKLAYWNATGSGKTLLMHINILQYKHYLKKYNKAQHLNRIIVLTPNEGLSEQHLKEFKVSGMPAELFDKQAGRLFSSGKIEIIDIHKLDEKSGDKTVAVDSFESNNLVLVDEGHRGSGGESWKDLRNRLCEAGFSFEYSATFGQAVNSQTGKKQKDLLNEYGKATLFDYSYKYFHKDGYGKDFQILNLSDQWSDEQEDLYLAACLLTFYEQLIGFKDQKQEIDVFNIEKPLAIFVGSKVTAVRKEANKDVSDVIRVLKFLEAFVRNPSRSISYIDRLLSNQDGINDNDGHSIFSNAFKYIRSKPGATPEKVYNSLLLEVFNSDLPGAFLHIDNLKGQAGEIGLRIGSAPYFGIINVGDDAKLLTLCKEQKLNTGEQEFARSAFQSINDKDSTINVLIGSKKFTEGWSSWRVSTMGLLNIGRGEGSEIIQLFGRGVRLKGYKMSLKRSKELSYIIRPDVIPLILPTLETLNIFSIRADYMQQFKEIIMGEGIAGKDDSESDYEKFKIDILPTIDNLSEKKLKYVRVKSGANFKKEMLVDAVLAEGLSEIILDWYPKVQVLASARTTNISMVNNKQEGKLRPEHLAFFDWDAVFFEIEKFKNERSWYNFNLTREDLRKVLYRDHWYKFYIPPAELDIVDFRQVTTWQEIGTILLKSFCERIYNFQKNRFFNSNSEVAILDSSHPNFIQEYNLLVKKSEERLIGKINELKELISSKELSSLKLGSEFEALYNSQHLYYPLLYIDKKVYGDLVQIQPVALNKGERDFVEDLRQFHHSSPEFFDGKELYLLRNISRKGIGFFEANYFYPDFIIWLVDADKQYVSFIDPKGLRQVQGLTDPKIQLHRTIRHTLQKQINDPAIELNAFIVSNTPFPQLSHWKGQESIEDFNKHHVYFQQEQKSTYIRAMLEQSMVATPEIAG